MAPALLQIHVVMDKLQSEFFTPPEYIINRDEPELSCNGFRFLNQQIWESENPSDDDSQTPVTVQNQRTIYITMVYAVSDQPVLNGEKATFTPFIEYYPTPYPDGIFHPPQFS